MVAIAALEKFYRDIRTKRGFNYHYLSVPATQPNLKPTLLFIHGFPSSSYDWRHQIEYFSDEGYGLIVPDVLGYAGTDKPTDVKAFRLSGMAADIIDILEKEDAAKVIVIGHDWGTALVSALAVFHSDRFLAFAWLATGHMPLARIPNLDEALEMQKKALGRPLFGYWKFFCSDEAPAVTAANMDSFLEVLYAADPDSWLTLMNQIGEIRKFVEEGKRGSRPAWLTDEDYDHIKGELVKGGLQSPFNWYKAAVQDVNAEDADKLSDDDKKIKKPAFLGTALKDYVCIAEFQKLETTKLASAGLTVVEFDVGHWLQLEAPEKVNKALEEWFAVIASP